MRALLPSLILLLASCSTPPPDEAVFTVPAGLYARAFDAARDVLADYRFELDRLDARAGVITTLPKASAGLATPWDVEQSSLRDEWEDFLNHQARVARVTFEPPATADDLRLLNVPLRARVEVVLLRRRRPGWRLETSSIRLSSFSRDGELAARGMWPRYDTPQALDEGLAARLGRDIRRRLMPPEPAAGE